MSATGTESREPTAAEKRLAQRAADGERFDVIVDALRGGRAADITPEALAWFADEAIKAVYAAAEIQRQSQYLVDTVERVSQFDVRGRRW